jgi:tRNA (guanine37-N1)-methyltransferase
MPALLWASSVYSVLAMRIDVLTLFPETFEGPFKASILGRALREGVAEVHLHNIRDYATDKHAVVDDYAYGGGPGMVMKPEPLAAAIEAVREMAEPPGRVVLLTPQGRLLNQEAVDELAAEPRLILLCGHYEGVDERIREHLVDDEISIGDYVLSGGEYAALVVIDAVVRRQPGTLGSADSLLEESHSDGLLEYPQYTRPAEFRGWRVPDILLSGHHGEIARWRRQQRVIRTAKRRPDLLKKARITEAERRLAAEHAPAQEDEDD